MQLESHGAEVVCRGALGDLGQLAEALKDMADRPGVRLHGIDSLGPLLDGRGSIGAVAARWLGACARPVRALLLDKSPAANWALGWHQDRTICVQARRDVDGFGPWSRKSGAIHVEPPFSVIAAMLTLRVHVDAVDARNAPLLVAPGSHRLGRVPVAEIEEAVVRCGTRACLAEAGDVWVYRTSILHASGAAIEPRRRRVLQVDYASTELPGDLRWAGI